jgi:hypothetical protein
MHTARIIIKGRRRAALREAVISFHNNPILTANGLWKRDVAEEFSNVWGNSASSRGLGSLAGDCGAEGLPQGEGLQKQTLGVMGTSFIAIVAATVGTESDRGGPQKVPCMGQGWCCKHH